MPLDLVDLLSSYQTHTKVAQTPDIDSSKEIAPADGFLQLAASELLNPINMTSSTTCGFGRLMLAVYWLIEIGLKYSPANHFMRLQLISILSPSGGLACVGRLLKELLSLNLKEALNVSLGFVNLAFKLRDNSNAPVCLLQVIASV